jgi:hypothetical protein
MHHQVAHHPPSDDSSAHPGPWEQLHLRALLWLVFPTLNNAFGISSEPMPQGSWLLGRRLGLNVNIFVFEGAETLPFFRAEPLRPIF